MSDTHAKKLPLGEKAICPPLLVLVESRRNLEWEASHTRRDSSDLKASREVGWKRHIFQGSKLSGVGKILTSVGGCCEVNPISHIVMDCVSKVAN